MTSEPPDHIRDARAVWQQPQAADRAQMRPADAAPETMEQAQAAWAPQAMERYTAPGVPQHAAQPATNGMAVAGMVLGITSLIFCWWGLFTLAQVVLAIVFGAKGLQRANAGGGGKGMATAGLVCGIIGAIFYVTFGVLTLGVGFLI
jgi:hypothetical protein